VLGGALLVLLTMDAAPIVPLAPLPNPAGLPPESIQPRPAHPYLRTAVEEVFVIGAGTAWYWRHPAYSSWDLHFDWTDWHSKLFTMREVVFDNDLFSTNGLAHPIAGSLYYQIARGNGLSPLASLVAAFFTSTAWEYIAEWDEKPSTNDLIFTPAGGAVIGEATYRLGRMFAAGSPGMGNCLGALLFSPVATLNETPVCRTVRSGPFDDFGLPKLTWHRLAFDLGQAYASFDGGSVVTALDAGFAASIVDHRTYRRSGQGLSALSPGAWSDIAWDTLINHEGLRGLEIHADGVWWGRYYRDFAPGDAGAPRRTDGWGVMLGLGSTFDYDARLLPLEWDRVVTAGLAGPMVEYADRHGSLTTRATFAAQYGFSMVTSLAYPAAAASLEGQTIKTELADQGYYYAQSVTGAATLCLEDQPIALFLRARFGSFWSINRDDRYQGKITDDFSLHDTRLYLRAAVTVRLLGGPLHLILALDQIDRDSALPGYAYDGVERRFSLSVSAVF